MNKRIERLLKNRKPVQTTIDKSKILSKIYSLIEGKSCGILLISEIDSQGFDKVSVLAFNCDKKHSNLVLSYLINTLPGIRTYLAGLMKTELKESNIFSKMVN